MNSAVPHHYGRLAPAVNAGAPRSTPAPTVSLRDYQQDFVDRVRIEYRNGHRSVLLVAGTGSGKTVIFSHIAKSAAAKGSRVLILAHRDQLIKQASRKLDDNGVQHGIIMAGFTPNARRLVQVASVLVDKATIKADSPEVIDARAAIQKVEGK